MDHAVLSSWLHHSGGFLFFLLGLGMVMCAVKLLQKTEGKGHGDSRIPVMKADG
jgi:hypothetical protein